MTTLKQLDKPENGVCDKCGIVTEPWFDDYFGHPEFAKWRGPARTCENCLHKEEKERMERSEREWEQKRFDESGLRPINRTMTFETFRVNSKNKATHDFIAAIEKPQSIFITGKCGVGKTHLASALAMKLFKEKKNIRFVNIPELLLIIKDTFKKGSGISELDIITEYTGCGVLFLDDLGAEKVSEWTLEAIFLLLDTRIRDMVPTIITSNLSISEIEHIFNDRIASRIAGNFKILEMTGSDYRISEKGR